MIATPRLGDRNMQAHSIEDFHCPKCKASGSVIKQSGQPPRISKGFRDIDGNIVCAQCATVVRLGNQNDEAAN